MFALTMLFGLESTKSAISEEASRGITDRFRSMPIPSAGVVLGRAGADLASSVLSLAVLVIGGVLIGWRPEGSPWAIALGILLLLWLRFALLWIGVFIGLAFRSQAFDHRHPGPGLAARVPLQRLRLDRDDAGLARRGDAVEPGVDHRDRRSAAVRQPDRGDRRHPGGQRGAARPAGAARDHGGVPAAVGAGATALGD